MSVIQDIFIPSDSLSEIKALRGLSEAKIKALKNKFKTVKILLIFLSIDSQLTGLKIIQNTAKPKQFTNSTVNIRTTSGTIFSADVRIRGGQVIFQYKLGAYLLKFF